MSFEHFKSKNNGGSRKSNLWRVLSKKWGIRGLVQFADLRGGLAKKRGVVFFEGLDGGVDGLIPQCSIYRVLMWISCALHSKISSELRS